VIPQSAPRDINRQTIHSANADLCPNKPGQLCIDVAGIYTRVNTNEVNDFKAKAEELGLSVDDLMIADSRADDVATGLRRMVQRQPSILALDKTSIPAVREQLLESYVQVARKGPGSKQFIRLGPVTAEGVARINAIFAKEGIDIDVTGYLHEVDAYAARHTIKGHGSKMAEAARRQLPVTAKDWALIPDILAAPDHIAYLGRADNGGEIIVVGKQVNGHVLYLAVARTGRRTLAAHTMEKFPGRWEDIAERVESLRKNRLVPGGGNTGAPALPLRPSPDPGTTNIGNARANINWSKIETGDNIQSILKELSNAFPDDVPPAQRGIASKEAMQAAADVLGVSVDEIQPSLLISGVDRGLVKKLDAGAAVLVEVRPTIDVMTVIKPVDNSRINKAKRMLQALGFSLDDFKGAGPEGRTLPLSFLASPMDEASRGLRLSDGRPDAEDVAQRLVENNEVGDVGCGGSGCRRRPPLNVLITAPHSAELVIGRLVAGERMPAHRPTL
jgi:hypothetical protein